MRPVARTMYLLTAFGVVAASLAIVALASPTLAAPGEDDTPADNPDLVTYCGLDVLTILDESWSVWGSGAVEEVRSAFDAMTRSLRNTGTRMAVVDFETIATLAIPYTTVTTDSISTVFDPYIQNDYDPGSLNRSTRTNWEDAFRVSRYFAPRPDPAASHIVVFMTDGNPNTIVDIAEVPYDPGNPVESENRYELTPELTADVDTTNVRANLAKNRAVPNSNALKAVGSHVLAVGVGGDFNNRNALNRLKAMSGPDVYDGSGTFDISTHDVFIVDEFDELEDAFTEIAFSLCSPSVTVQKLVDLTPDPGTDDAFPQSDWLMTATVTAAGGFDWVLPPGVSGDTATRATGADGLTMFQWNTHEDVSSEITVVEEDPTDPENPTGVPLINDATATSCVFRTPDDLEDRPLAITVGDGEFDAAMPTDSIVTCTFLNRAEPDPAITLEKQTNGFDADVPTGPLIGVGDAVTWTYVVTNAGNVTLDIVVSDDQLGAITCPVTSLAPGESTECEAHGTATPGQYANLGTATGTDPFGTVVEATDPSHYFSEEPGIHLEKSTNGVDADTPEEAPFVEIGEEVTWTYLITNGGNVPLQDVTLVDDQIGVVACPTTVIAVGETITCETTGTVTAGLYANIGTATGLSSAEALVEATDPSHYFGVDASIDIEKATNGDDADVPTGPDIEVGAPVVWTYVVTNPGNVPLANVTVTDDQGVVPVFIDGDVNGDALLDPGEIWIYEASGTAVAGQYVNSGTATGVDPLELVVEATDPSHYFGIDASIDIEKATNAEDADAAPGVQIAVGEQVTWTYIVTNTGNVALSDIVLVDDQGVAPSFIDGDVNDDGLLDIGETWTYEATGFAITGQYTNLATVTGVVTAPEDATAATTFAIGDTVSDQDLSNYFGFVAGIDVEKSTNGVDADVAPGVEIPSGDTVTWIYVVTNVGDSAIADIVLVDDQGEVPVFIGGDTNGDTILDPDEIWTFEAGGTAKEGQYTNVATVTGIDVVGGTVADVDPSNYTGVSDGLPATGIEAGALALIALILLGGGAVLLGITRSRSRKKEKP